MGKESKWKSEIRIGDDVYFIDDYSGVQKGVVINIQDKFKPSKFQIADINNNKIHEVLPTRVYQEEGEAKRQQRLLLKTGFNDLCEKLALNIDDALFMLKIFKIEKKYTREQINKMVDKKVKVVISGDESVGILRYKKNYADDSIWQSFYYIEEPIGNFYGSTVRQAFQIFNIDKIELI